MLAESYTVVADCCIAPWSIHIRIRSIIFFHAEFSAPLLSETEYATLVDFSTLFVVLKKVLPPEKQLPNESRKLWDAVTTRLLPQEYREGTKAKLAQKQRDEAVFFGTGLTANGLEHTFIPQYFEQDISSGIPVLTAAGRKAVEEALRDRSNGWPTSS
ncbi:hypothetical protein DFJ58DRAFT_888742 [Suillus subalutaceus]|uniref:uncharacterized protein n=1 Tax=Suillus subalutaceus TaxID=48586 RepID=UPI001B862B72|nr:uncharacterized protein DFJ58DRAFT_888742 [Suillus subalutaceus]KAG1849632.1 hypothetical protein DFJ58DRAFT_888742 [Suillus subalutaceus]